MAKQIICDSCRLEIKSGAAHSAKVRYYGVAPTVYDLCGACMIIAMDAVGLRNTVF